MRAEVELRTLYHSTSAPEESHHLPPLEHLVGHPSPPPPPYSITFASTVGSHGIHIWNSPETVTGGFRSFVR